MRLLQCIYNLCKSLDSNQTRLYTLMAENARLGVAPSDANELIFEKNKMEITKIRSLIDEEKIALRSDSRRQRAVTQPNPRPTAQADMF